MQHEPVTSSFITHVGHDPATNTLEIKFKNGTVERHDGVTAEDHQRFLLAPSLGKHWNQHLKGKGTKIPA